MTQKHDSIGDRRAAELMEGLENAKSKVHTGPIGLLIRVALLVIFMYLILTSFILFGTSGPVFISLLFIVALFIPYLYQTLREKTVNSRIRKVKRDTGEETTQEV